MNRFHFFSAHFCYLTHVINRQYSYANSGWFQLGGYPNFACFHRGSKSFFTRTKRSREFRIPRNLGPIIGGFLEKSAS